MQSKCPSITFHPIHETLLNVHTTVLGALGLAPWPNKQRNASIKRVTSTAWPILLNKIASYLTVGKEIHGPVKSTGKKDY